MSDEERYQYSYSAKQQEEIQKIRKKYLPQENDKFEQLRRLDASAEKKGTIVSMVVGLISMLILGVGMSCTMVWGGDLFVPGCIIGIVGIIGIALACPIYYRITARQREKIAPQILKLTEELTDSASPEK